MRHCVARTVFIAALQCSSLNDQVGATSPLCQIQHAGSTRCTEVQAVHCSRGGRLRSMVTKFAHCGSCSAEFPSLGAVPTN